jgi:aspartyl-tRNA(Asn)/glutamyl-tRNA(Gln) amidotransferase subunit C
MSDSRINKKEVEHIAELSAIYLTQKEIDAYSQDLSMIIESVDRLQELDTEDVEITTHVTGLKNITRNDEVEESLDRQEVLKNAANRLQGYFVVKRVINN